jgi:predicted Fe-Mo cluster-binding NifX family protein
MEASNTTRIAIPSMTEGGLESDICAHFGSCEYFTIVDISNGKPKDVCAVSNASPDGVHNCAAPAELLKNNHVDAVIVSGIGGRPLVSLTIKGIRVFGGAFGRVSDALNDYASGALSELSDQGTCNCSHH